MTTFAIALVVIIVLLGFGFAGLLGLALCRMAKSDYDDDI